MNICPNLFSQIGAHSLRLTDPSATPSRAMPDVLRHYDSSAVLKGPGTVLQQGKYIAHKFESGWEVGVIKAFEEGPSRWQVQRSTGFCWGSRAVISLEVTMTVSAGGPIFCFVVLLKSL